MRPSYHSCHSHPLCTCSCVSVCVSVCVSIVHVRLYTLCCFSDFALPCVCLFVCLLTHRWVLPMECTSGLHETEVLCVSPCHNLLSTPLPSFCPSLVCLLHALFRSFSSSLGSSIAPFRRTLSADDTRGRLLLRAAESVAGRGRAPPAQPPPAQPPSAKPPSLQASQTGRGRESWGWRRTRK